MAILTLVLFVCILLGCVIFNVSIVAALALGYVLFAAFTLSKKFTLRQLLGMSLEGIRTTGTILITFLLIGILTALWRAGGTIPAIVSYSAGLISPGLFPLITFLLCCMVSFLTGTAFGTSATMGAICVSVAQTLGLDLIPIGGAVLGGSYFGDRFSPVSTSALLVATVTNTSLYDNLRRMVKTTLVPFVLTCLIYAIWGYLLPTEGSAIPDIEALFSSQFRLGVICVIPAVLILIAALCKLHVRLVMLISIAASVLVCVFYQKLPVLQILRFSIFGYTTEDPALQNMISGGGVVSMLRVTAIVFLSSSYSGIFRQTGLLAPVTRLIEALGKKLPVYWVVLLTSVVTGAFACNQTLSIMLTDQLCGHMEEDKGRFALYLENSAVVIVPLLPWTVACSVSLTSAGAPANAFVAALFLMLLPICSMIIFRTKMRNSN